jgi:hypothetical protein
LGAIFWGWVTALDGLSESIGRMDGLDGWHLLGLSDSSLGGLLELN